MKLCPKCGNVYTDETLSFCLADGTTLVFQTDSEKTEKFSNLVVDVQTDENAFKQTRPTNKPTEETVIYNEKREGVSPVWILATFGLLGLILIGVFSAWLFWDKLFDTKNADVVQNIDGKGGNANIQPTPKPTVEKTPTPAENLYRVVGVKSNDVLYIRPAAGNLKVEVGRIPPNATGIKVVGGGKKVGKNLWLPIVYNGTRGWVNGRYITRQK